jgi:hypothetical protein
MTPALRDGFQGITDVLTALPPREVVVGAELQFLRSLTDSQAEGFQRVSRDPLSDQKNFNSRSLENLMKRPPAEVALLQLGVLKTLNLGGLLEVVEKCTGVISTGLRTRHHFSVPDRNGIRVQFVAPKLLPAIMEHVCHIWNGLTYDEGDALRRALWLLAITLNAHPVADGNGRLARAIFNGYLIKHKLCPHGALPLGGMIYLSAGNFELAVRRLEIFGDWLPLIEVMTNILQFYQLCIDSNK